LGVDLVVVGAMALTLAAEEVEEGGGAAEEVEEEVDEAGGAEEAKDTEEGVGSIDPSAGGADTFRGASPCVEITDGRRLRSFPLPWRFSAAPPSSSVAGGEIQGRGDRGDTGGLVPAVSPDALE
jgi:hypothetical protein